MTLYDTIQDPRELEPGDLVDLSGLDQNQENQHCWEFEYAEVESVSTIDKPSGGWQDGLLRDVNGAPTGFAIVYVTNGAAPAVVNDPRQLLPPTLHKAMPAPDALSCRVCGQRVHRVTAGQGSTWVHSDSGAVVARNPPAQGN